MNSLNFFLWQVLRGVVGVVVFVVLGVWLYGAIVLFTPVVLFYLVTGKESIDAFSQTWVMDQYTKLGDWIINAMERFDDQKPKTWD